jgi:hypothetical protein
MKTNAVRIATPFVTFIISIIGRGTCMKWNANKAVEATG